MVPVLPTQKIGALAAAVVFAIVVSCGAAASSETIEGGNITAVLLPQDRNTTVWHGYAGNITIVSAAGGTFTVYVGGLTSGGGNISGVEYSINCTEISGYVLVSNVSATPDPSLFVPGGFADLDNITGYGPDSGNKTFNYTTTFTIAGNTINNVPTTYTFVDSAPQTTSFGEGYVTDGTAMIFMTPIEMDTVGYSSDVYDFQFIVPTTSGGTRNYYVYFYLECEEEEEEEKHEPGPPGTPPTGLPSEAQTVTALAQKIKIVDYPEKIEMSSGRWAIPKTFAVIVQNVGDVPVSFITVELDAPIRIPVTVTPRVVDVLEPGYRQVYLVEIGALEDVAPGEYAITIRAEGSGGARDEKEMVLKVLREGERPAPVSEEEEMTLELENLKEVIAVVWRETIQAAAEGRSVSDVLNILDNVVAAVGKAEDLWNKGDYEEARRRIEEAKRLLGDAVIALSRAGRREPIFEVVSPLYMPITIFFATVFFIMLYKKRKADEKLERLRQMREMETMRRAILGKRVF